MNKPSLETATLTDSIADSSYYAEAHATGKLGMSSEDGWRPPVQTVNMAQIDTQQLIKNQKEHLSRIMPDATPTLNR